jgi:glycosyltransferase involved in cell wall biosynthesis
MLQGTHGKQRKEVAALTDWLASEVRPDVVILTNALLSGVIPELERRLRVPIFVTLQGDDVFLDALPAADREKCIELIRRNCSDVAGFIATSRYYCDHMATYLGLLLERIHVVYPGINLAGHGGARTVRTKGPLTVGYFARICPEKGFHNLVEAYVRLRQMPGAPLARLRASGWLGENSRAFFNEQLAVLKDAGLDRDFEYVDSPTHADKVRFLQSVDVLSVPTTYREPKGLYLLEAWANGLPVVQPQHGAFRELIEESGGGLLVEPNDSLALAEGLRRILEDHSLRDQIGRAGEAAVRERFTAGAMARGVASLLEQTTALSKLPT